MSVTTPRAAGAIAHERLEFDDEPRRRLSILRVLLAIVLLGGAGYGGFLLVQNRIQNYGSVPGTWFAPYVDVTLTPNYQFQLPTNNKARQSVLGFVVSNDSSACAPSWGGVYSLEEANQSLNLDSRIAQVRTEGASPIVAFGGQKNTSLQVGCFNQSALTGAFTSVIDRYHLHAIDLDVEGSALNDFAANRRLAVAMARIQASPGHRHLAVWLSVPVETSGLQDNAQSLVATMLRAHVNLAGVDTLSMDFTDTTPNLDMLGAVEASLNSTHAQLSTLFHRYGVSLRSKILWNHMGVTVMIGQNNETNQVFTLGNAHGLVSFARRTGLGRVSFWSLNRDAQCGSSFAESGVLSTTCSGVAEPNLGFSKVFAQLTGTVDAGEQSSQASLAAIQPDTNPADSPYPQWNGTQPYVAGYKVVRQGFIYQAKWYNQGDDPATPVQFQYQTPWLMVGPVLPGSHAPKLPTLPEGTYPDWSITQSYLAGAKVLLNGLPYEAKWDTQGASPAAEQSDPSASPWLPLFNIPGEPTNSG
jgi:chitinase